MHALAGKIAPALTPSHTFSIEMKDISQSPSADLNAVGQALADQFAIFGARPAEAASADVRLQITISQDVDGYLLVAELNSSGAPQTVIVPVANPEKSSAQPGRALSLDRKIVWQQSGPILDFAQTSIDANRALTYLLEPDQIEAYEFSEGAQTLHQAQPVRRLRVSRDPRGRLEAIDATHVTAFLGGVQCDVVWNPSFGVQCHENPGQQWPMGAVSWRFDASRNYFSGSMTFADGLETKFPAFYSAASPSPEIGGLSGSRWVVAGIDGRTQLFAGSAEAASTFQGWGSDVATFAPTCGSQWLVLATGTSDWTQPDRLQLYEISDRRATALGQPLDVPGPVIALWPASDGKSARAVVRNLDSGLYEASNVTVSCGN